MVIEWNEEQVATLKRLRAEGLSASAIGRELGCTRNAVVGKVNRLGLLTREQERIRDAEMGNAPPKAAPKPPKVVRGEPSRPGVLLHPDRPLPQVAQARREEPDEEPIVAEPGNVTVLSLTARTCKFALWGNMERPRFDRGFFCGARTVEGKPWRAHHQAIVYSREQPTGPRHAPPRYAR